MNQIFKTIKNDESGQSLVEILVALTIGAILIGAASTAVITVLQSGTTSQRQQTATVLAQDYLEKVRTFSSADWHNIYNLSKTSSTLYHFEASSTQILAVQGEEGVIDNDIRGNLAGYWALDEASSTITHDKSGNGNNGTINGATATSTECKVGRCFHFDADDVTIPHSSTLNFGNTDEFTMSVWVQKTSNPPDGNVVGIFGKQSGLDRFGIDYYFEGNEVRGGIRNGTDGQQSFSATPTNNLLDWNHVVFVYEPEQSDGMRLYLNGNLAASSSNVGFSDFGSTADLKIGSNFSLGGTPRNFRGYIDDVRIYNNALSVDDIEHIYNSAIFTRYFYVDDVCRTNDADDEIAGTKPCDSGEKEDPSTQKITVVVKWGSSGEFILDDYVTRWRNRVFPQDDWSGGSGLEGPVTEPTNQYSSSSDVSTSTGSLKIEGI